MYYRGAAAAIVVFDVTNKDSFSGAKTWVKELQRRGDANCVIALAGNKADLLEQRKVSKESRWSSAVTARRVERTVVPAPASETFEYILRQQAQEGW